MKNYDNTFLLIDNCTDEIDAVIFTNETDDEKLQGYINTAKDKWYSEESPDCLMVYILDELDKNIEYEINYLSGFDNKKLYY